MNFFDFKTCQNNKQWTISSNLATVRLKESLKYDFEWLHMFKK